MVEHFQHPCIMTSFNICIYHEQHFGKQNDKEFVIKAFFLVWRLFFTNRSYVYLIQKIRIQVKTFLAKTFSAIKSPSVTSYVNSFRENKFRSKRFPDITFLSVSVCAKRFPDNKFVILKHYVRIKNEYVTVKTSSHSWSHLSSYTRQH